MILKSVQKEKGRGNEEHDQHGDLEKSVVGRRGGVKSVNVSKSQNDGDCFYTCSFP